MSSAGATQTPLRRRRAGRLITRALVALMLGFAALGAGALIWTDDARLLRLGIVAALWAALVGAFVAARYRRQVLADHDHEDELRRVYELELEREVAARREYELEVEAQTRRRVEEEVQGEVRDELNGLRAELRTLRQNLEALLGGEVLVERVALRAESTRLQSLSDQSRAARAANLALPRGSADREEQGREPQSAGSGAATPPASDTPAERTDVLPRYSEPSPASGLSINQPTEFKPLRRVNGATKGAGEFTAEEDTGSHAVGRSVSELLSTLGQATGEIPVPRRRRRRDDAASDT